VHRRKEGDTPPIPSLPGPPLIHWILGHQREALQHGLLGLPLRRAGEPLQPGGFTYGYNCGNTSKRTMADSSSRFGFVAFAETWNGRLAMLGFVIGLATELLTGQGILSQIGLG